MWNGIENQAWANISATPSSFTLRGGAYALMVNAGTVGTVTLQRLGNDGSSWVTAMPAVTSAGLSTANLPNGTYRLNCSGSSGLYAELVSIVTTL